MRYKINKNVNMVSKLSKERFNPEGECRYLAIDAIMIFFNIFIKNKKEIYHLNSLKKIKNFFENKGLFVSGYISPKLKKFDFFCRYKNFTTDKIYFFNKSIFQNQKYAFLYLISAKDLYNIDELWNHFICVLRDENGQTTVYDSYFDIVYGVYKIRAPVNYAKLDDKNIICLKVSNTYN